MKVLIKKALKIMIAITALSTLMACTYTGFHPGCDIRVNTCGKSIPVNEYSK